MATLLKSDLKRDKGKKKYALQDQPVQLNAPQFFQFFLFVFIEVNILTIDFALWNYHEGNKIWRIWMIEMSVILSALYFIV